MPQHPDVFISTRLTSNAADVLIYTSSAGTGTNYARTVTETVGAAADTVTRVFAGARTTTETLAAAETISRGFIGSRTVTETVSSSQTITRALITARANSESVAVSDTVSRVFAGARTISETVSLSESIARVLVLARTLSETLTATDTVSRLVSGTRTVTELVTFAETVTRLFVGARTITETVGPAADTVTRQITPGAGQAESSSSASGRLPYPLGRAVRLPAKFKKPLPEDEWFKVKIDLEARELAILERAKRQTRVRARLHRRRTITNLVACGALTPMSSPASDFEEPPT
jgi:hypothetical protein